MRRDQNITITKNNSQTDLIVVQDGDLDTPEWLDLDNIDGSDIEWQIAEGTTDANFDATDVVYDAPADNIRIVQWGNTDATWPDRFTTTTTDADGNEITTTDPPEPPNDTLIIQVEVPPEATKDLLVSPTNESGGRDPELIRECKIKSPDDFALQRTAISVVQGEVTVLPSTDDGTTV